MIFRKKVLLIYSHDRMANTLRAKKIKSALEKKGLSVQLFDSTVFFTNFYNKLDKDTFWSWIKYKLRFLEFLCQLWSGNNSIKKYPFLAKLNQRAKAIAKTKEFLTSNIILIQSPFEMMVLLHKYPWQTTIYDAHTCFADEISLTGKVSSSIELGLIAQAEKKVLEKADLVTFAWPSIKRFLIKKYHFRFKKTVVANWGCEKQLKKASLKKKPQIIFLGNMSDYWVDSLGLANLVKASQFKIDLFGRSQNPTIINLDQYHGYLPHAQLNRVANYQFGLITLSKDELRRETFSAKHLLYFSFGLPVLCPEWRRDEVLAPGTIYYKTDNFNQVVKKYSQSKLWHKKHLAALKIAKSHNWRKQLKLLVNTIADF